MNLQQSDIIAAINVARGMGLLSGSWNGMAGPKRAAGRYYLPEGLMAQLTSITKVIAASQYYIAPFYVDRPTTFAGAFAYNSGAGDNGKNLKFAAYSEAASGGPGTLAKSFGAVGITAASAVRTAASSWSAAPGWYYLEMTSDSNPTMYCMISTGNLSAAGEINPPANMRLGSIGAPLTGATNYITGIPLIDQVAGTYANFPEATSLTPTSTSSANTDVPLFGLYT